MFPKNYQDAKLGDRNKVQPALTFDLPLEIWNQYLSESNVRLGEMELNVSGFSYQQTYLQALIDSGKLIPLLIERNNQLEIVRAGQLWQPSDRIICLLQNPQPQLLKQLSGVATNRLTLEKLPHFLALPNL